VAADAAEKHASGEGLGLVIVNLQETPYDGCCRLRIFGTLDEVSAIPPLSHNRTLSSGSLRPSLIVH